MSKPRISINLNDLFSVNYAHVFISLEPAIKNDLCGWPEVRDRLENAVEFARQIGGEVSDSFRTALLRAALTELCSIEDMQPEPKHRLNSHGSPLLCVVRELRNLEVHVSTSPISNEERALKWGHMDNPNLAQDVNWHIYWVRDVVGRFQIARNYKAGIYDTREFDQAANWFDSLQRRWGITEMLYRAANAYAEELLGHLKNSHQAKVKVSDNS